MRNDEMAMASFGGRAVAARCLVAMLAALAAEPVVGTAEAGPAPAVLERIRYVGTESYSRVIAELSDAVSVEVMGLAADPAHDLPSRVVLDVGTARVGAGAKGPVTVDDALLRRIRTGQFRPETARIVLDLSDAVDYRVFTLPEPFRIVVDLRAKGATEVASLPAADGETGRAALPAGRSEGAVERRAPSPNETEGRPQPPEMRAAAPPSPRDPPQPADSGPAGEGAQGPDLAAHRPILRPREPPREPRELVDRAPSPAAASPEESPTSGTPSWLPPSRGVSPGISSAALPPSPSGGGFAPPDPGPLAAREAQRRLRVMIDPGHGGKDPGAQALGLAEKDVVLSISKDLAERLRRKPGVEVLLTREDDRFLSLEERTGLANAAGADLFISVHANASPRASARGIEVYYLNNTDNRGTLRLAAMENNLRWNPRDRSLQEEIPDLSYILSDLRQTYKVEESRLLADSIGHSMVSHLSGRYDPVDYLGTKEGPFYVLVGAYMPCVLVEVSFLTNPLEARRLKSPAYRAEVAAGIEAGIEKYLRETELASGNL